MFIIQEFETAFSTRYCSISHFILHGKTVYGVRLHCKKFRLKHKCFNHRSTRPNESPLKTLSLYVQYAWVSSCCFNAIYQWKQLHLTLGNCIQCALILYRMRVETQVFYPLISQRSCYVLHFTCTRKWPWTLCSICKRLKLLFQRDIAV